MMFGPATFAGEYLIQPGDVLRVSVWREPDLQQELLVRPDGGVNLPLAGAMQAAGRTVDALREEVATRIEPYITDPVVTVQVLRAEGNMIYVLGKVNRSGAYAMNRPLDVMQALALAGGLAVFALEDEISVLRRTESGQQALPFKFAEVERGRHLEQNIVLEPGDVIVVP